MDQAHVTIIDQAIELYGKSVNIKIDHLLDVVDDEEQYTGCYRVTLSNGQEAIVRQDNERWIEDKNGPTELSHIAGQLIENYVE